MKEIKAILLAIWLLSISYALFLAPVEVNLKYVATLFSLEEPEPLIMAIFFLLGIWPMVFGLLVLDNDQSSISAWPYVILSFLVGVFALLPYFIFHRDQRHNVNRTPTQLREIIHNPFFPFALFIFTNIFTTYGFMYGSIEVLQEAFYTSRLVHVLVIDFALLTLLSVLGITHHSYHQKGHGTWLCVLGVIPIIGSLSYLFITYWQEGREG